MIDVREIVANGLLSVIPNVKMSKPSGDVDLPLICYAETSNTAINIASDLLKYRVAIYANTFEEMNELYAKVDNVMSHCIGMQRTATTSDADSNIGTDMYLKRIDYACTLNKAGGYIIRNAI